MTTVVGEEGDGVAEMAGDDVVGAMGSTNPHELPQYPQDFLVPESGESGEYLATVAHQ